MGQVFHGALLKAVEGQEGLWLLGLVKAVNELVKAR